MYKFLLANRYLRTRFIALASVISVTLGVATLIVVNSVMSGFSGQMKERIRGIMSDVMVEAFSMDGVRDPRGLMAEVRRIVGDSIVEMTPVVEIPGMMCFDWMGQKTYRPVTLIGIDLQSKDLVSPLRGYLLSRQSVYENDELVREPRRDPASPLDWDLDSEAKETRRQSVRQEELNEINRRVQNELRQQRDQRETGSNPFALDVAGAPTESGVIPASGQGAPLLDPFAAATDPNVKPINPLDPQPMRLIVGAGLISFPYKDDRGTRTWNMVNPGQDVICSTVKAGTPEAVHFKATVVDVLKSGMSEYDSNLVFCNLAELQACRAMLIPKPGQTHAEYDWGDGAITTLQIKLKDYADAAEVVRRLRAELPDGHIKYQVRTWEEKQGPLLEAVAVESAILNVLLFLIIMVAGFGILAIFYMIVVEKTRDIGILKALGASSQGVMSIFLSYGLSLGVVGSGAGVVLGLLFVHYINEIEALISLITGRKVFDETIYYFHDIPTAVHASMVFSVALGAMLIAVLASVLPARRAAALHPVRALRYE